jgi:hypothetical protein
MYFARSAKIYRTSINVNSDKLFQNFPTFSLRTYSCAETPNLAGYKIGKSKCSRHEKPLFPIDIYNIRVLVRCAKFYRTNTSCEYVKFFQYLQLSLSELSYACNASSPHTYVGIPKLLACNRHMCYIYSQRINKSVNAFFHITIYTMIMHYHDREEH